MAGDGHSCLQVLSLWDSATSCLGGRRRLLHGFPRTQTL